MGRLIGRNRKTVEYLILFGRKKNETIEKFSTIKKIVGNFSIRILGSNQLMLLNWCNWQNF